MPSLTRSISRIDCSRDAYQASAGPDDAGPALWATQLQSGSNK